MPESGRTTVAKAISQNENYCYIDATSWVRSTFREPKDKELPQQYQDELHSWVLNRLKINPQIIIDNVHDAISTYSKLSKEQHFVIDGLFSPKDFSQLFDYNQDIVVFVNRTNNQSEYKDYENIGVSVIRDYCFWLSSAECLPKQRWIEYNFTIPGSESGVVKTLGHKNSVFIVRSINTAIAHLHEQLINLLAHQS